ncbi:MAG: sigma 54-interacting transcriptional regulator [Deltaproteobacteria bacterium]|nr:sigma 54-interacting transcriptional regulator [Deltaproteobacteria bacterium]
MANEVIIQVNDSGLGRKYSLDGALNGTPNGGVVLGRASDADIQLLGGLISKRHARVYRADDRYFIEDLASRNGVTVNGVRITKPARLEPNDLFAIGDAAFLFAPDLEVLPMDGGDKAVIVTGGNESDPTRPGFGHVVPVPLAAAPTPVEAFLGKSADLKTLLSELLRFVEERIPFGAAGLMRAREQSFEPVCLASSARTVSLPKGLLRAALARDQLLYVPDAAADTSFAGAPQVGTPRSIVVAPLKAGSETTGLLFLHADRPRAYEAAHLDALAALVPSIAVVLGLWDRQQTLAATLERMQVLHATKTASAIVGDSPVWRELRALIAKVSAAPSPVLIQGESGTGKELVARELHAGSRSAGPAAPFVAINCGAIPEHLMESELFGYEKGAFTGAQKRTPGKLELAHGGTLFLDEIGDLPLALQVKLLRALQEKQFYRLGGAQPVSIDFRLLAATHRELRAMVGAGKFREDLFYRINVVNMTLPPLREHADDVPLLVDHFLAEVNADLHRRVRGVERTALAALCRYSWPGNVRELKNVIERAVVLLDGDVIRVSDLPAEILADHGLADAPADATLPRQLDALEKKLITSALKRARGKKVAAARALGISRPTLDKKIKDYAIDAFAAEEA